MHARKTATEAQNPFRYGALALDESFADRREELAELEADIRSGQDVVIVAPRRYGKSSLVWEAASRLRRSGVLICHVDLMVTPTKEKLAERLARSIFEDVASPGRRARETALAPFRGLTVTPTITVSPEDGRFTFSFAASQRGEDIDATLERLLEMLGEVAKSRKRPAALIIDEFQEVASIDRSLPRLLRSVFQEQPAVSHVYMGSRRHMMESIFNDENEPFWRSAKPMTLGPIPTDLFADFVADRFTATGREAEAGTVASLLEHTGGHPYATQELSYALWAATPPGAIAGEAQLEDALRSVLRSEHAHFSLLWSDASATQRLLLAALAVEPGKPFSNDFRRRHRLPAPASLQRPLASLVDREIVGRDGDGNQAIIEPFLAEWIREIELGGDWSDAG